MVSAMTVPALIQNYQRKTYVTQLHKVYNETQQAAIQYINDRNAINLKEAGLTSTDAAANWVKTYFKISTDCGTDYSPCFADEYKRLTGASVGALFSKDGGTKYKFILASGASFSISVNSAGNLLLYVDTNGPKGPNIIGRDTFALRLYENCIIDDSDVEITYKAPLTKEQRDELFESYCSGGSADSAWWGCFGKILNDNWEMTY